MIRQRDYPISQSLADTKDHLSKKETLKHLFASDISDPFEILIQSVEDTVISGKLEFQDTSLYFMINLKPQNMPMSQTVVSIIISDKPCEFTAKYQKQLKKSTKNNSRYTAIAAVALVALLIPAGLFGGDHITAELGIVTSEADGLKYLAAQANSNGNYADGLYYAGQALIQSQSSEPGDRINAFLHLRESYPHLEPYSSAFSTKDSLITIESSSGIVMFYPDKNNAGYVIPRQLDDGSFALDYPGDVPIVYPVDGTYPAIIFDRINPNAPPVIVSPNDPDILDLLSPDNLKDKLMVQPPYRTDIDLKIRHAETFFGGPNDPVAIHPYGFGDVPVIVFADQESSAAVLRDGKSNNDDDKPNQNTPQDIHKPVYILSSTQTEITPDSMVPIQYVTVNPVDLEDIPGNIPVRVFVDGPDSPPVDFPLGTDFHPVIDPTYVPDPNDDTGATTSPPLSDYQDSDGSAGSTGTDGSAGSTETDGSAGSTGTDGSAGSTGTDGSAGSTGTDGSAGSTGTDGSAGSTGTDGSAGSTGTDGSAGSTGTDGSAGSTGTDGSAGSTGTDGSAGSTGTDGSAGSTGTDGSAGSTGTSGSAAHVGSTATGGSHESASNSHWTLIGYGDGSVGFSPDTVDRKPISDILLPDGMISPELSEPLMLDPFSPDMYAMLDLVQYGDPIVFSIDDDAGNDDSSTQTCTVRQEMGSHESTYWNFNLYSTTPPIMLNMERNLCDGTYLLGIDRNDNGVLDSGYEIMWLQKFDAFQILHNIDYYEGTYDGLFDADDPLWKDALVMDSDYNYYHPEDLGIKAVNYHGSDIQRFADDRYGMGVYADEAGASDKHFRILVHAPTAIVLEDGSTTEAFGIVQGPLWDCTIHDVRYHVAEKMTGLYMRTEDPEDSTQLYIDALDFCGDFEASHQNPDKYLSHWIAGIASMQHKKGLSDPDMLLQSKLMYEEALAMSPDNPFYNSDYCLVNHQLGMSTDECVPKVVQAIKDRPDVTWFQQVHVILTGDAYRQDS